MSNSTLASPWQLLGPSNVIWCEFLVSPFSYTDAFGEFWNTTTSFIYVLVGLLGILKGRSSCFVIADLSLLIVGLGSAFFHATQSYAGQMTDELPMSILAASYMYCMLDSHWLIKRLLPVYFVVVAVSWIAYMFFNQHDLFVACFTVQIAYPSLVSLNVGPLSITSRERKKWWIYLFCILGARLAWETERYLWRSSQCPTQLTDPLYWFHPVWHLLSALAHKYWLEYAEDLPSLKELGAEKKSD